MLQLLLGSLFASIFHPNLGAVTVSDVCLGCICEAASGCDRTMECDKGLCGPFRISLSYWEDAGSPILNDDSKNLYEDCTKDLACAAETVRNYMIKYPTDCNDDKKIDCKDFVRTHFSGAECKGNTTKRYVKTFNTCIRTMKKLKLKN